MTTIRAALSNCSAIAAAAEISQAMGAGQSEEARALAYRPFSISERKGRADEALAYNTIVASWGDVQAQAAKKEDAYQGTLGFE